MELTATEIVGMGLVDAADQGAAVVFQFVDMSGTWHTFGCPREFIAEILFRLSAAAQAAIREAGIQSRRVGELEPILGVEAPRTTVGVDDLRERVLISFEALRYPPLTFALTTGHSRDLAASLEAGIASLATMRSGTA